MAIKLTMNFNILLAMHYISTSCKIKFVGKGS